jgi:hypothetical protein
LLAILHRHVLKQSDLALSSLTWFLLEWDVAVGDVVTNTRSNNVTNQLLAPNLVETTSVLVDFTQSHEAVRHATRADGTNSKSAIVVNVFDVLLGYSALGATTKEPFSQLIRVALTDAANNFAQEATP